MANTPAPPRGLGQAHTAKTFAKAFAADIDLRTQASLPPHAAQLVDATNESASVETIVCTTDDGKTLTKAIPGGATYPFPVAIASIAHASTGDNISIAAYWWDTSGLPRNPA
jgi:hypothetical protein